ncbi:MAG TPA: SgcJ/EcaC family oxidoreductase [Terracidiphilus sp.]|jgi:uncharacterized protein (TIGR02246 family)|nr:SgcJ/EcaC family oxidoreductase [Terracidiphilus sp.]
MLTMGMLAVALLVPAAITLQGGHKADEQAIHGVMDGFMDAWNHHDARAWTALFAEDADFTNVHGVGASGRSDIEEFHARVFAAQFKNSHQKYTGIKTRFIRPDVAAVDVHWEMMGATDPAGNPVPLRQGLLNFVMTKSEGKWQIVVMHNMNLDAPPAAE